MVASPLIIIGKRKQKMTGNQALHLVKQHLTLSVTVCIISFTSTESSTLRPTLRTRFQHLKKENLVKFPYSHLLCSTFGMHFHFSHEMKCFALRNFSTYIVQFYIPRHWWICLHVVKLFGAWMEEWVKIKVHAGDIQTGTIQNMLVRFRSVG